MAKKVNIYDIANAAGVSISSVSRVINDSGYVKKEKKEKILKILKKYEYSPNRIARSLAMKSNNTIGVVLSYSGMEYLSLFATRILEGISQYLKIEGKNLMLIWDNINDAKRINYEDSIKNVDGVLLFDINCDQKTINKIKKTDKPFVIINERTKNSSENYVAIDNYYGGYLAVKYLIEKGHEDICIITGDLSVQSGYDRYAGAIDAMLQNNIKIKDYYIRKTNFNPDSAREEIKKIYKKKVKKYPTAVFASSDLMAMAVIDELKHIDFRVPEDVSIIGFDNSIIASAVNPPLTTVDQPLYQMGYRSAEILDNFIKNKEEAEITQEILPVELVERSSVNKI